MDFQLAGHTLHRQDRTAHTQVGEVCAYLLTPAGAGVEVEYLVINCRPQYLPREYSAILFVAVYLPPQTDDGAKTALSQLYKEIRKQ